MRRRTFCWSVLVAYGALSGVVNKAVWAAEPQVTLLALGDSLTAGYGVTTPESFPAQLEAALRGKGHDVRVINAGVSGDTSAGGLARLDWALADQPQAAIVELGANDALRGLDIEAMRRNLDAIVGKLQAAGVKVLLAGMEAPRNLGPEYAVQYRAAFAQVAKEHATVFYPFFLEGVRIDDPTLWQKDNLHPNGRGVAILVTHILPTVDVLLDQVGP